VKTGDTLYRAEVTFNYATKREQVVIHEAVVQKVMPQTVRFLGSEGTGYVRVMAIEIAETLLSPTRVEALNRAGLKINQEILFWEEQIVKLQHQAELIREAIKREPAP
jgi:hypothetical protein